MSDQHDQAPSGACATNRRGFLGTSAGIAVAASVAQAGITSAQESAGASKTKPLPKRKLGRTGV